MKSGPRGKLTRPCSLHILASVVTRDRILHGSPLAVVAGDLVHPGIWLAFPPRIRSTGNRRLEDRDFFDVLQRLGGVVFEDSNGLALAAPCWCAIRIHRLAVALLLTLGQCVERDKSPFFRRRFSFIVGILIQVRLSGTILLRHGIGTHAENGELEEIWLLEERRLVQRVLVAVEFFPYLDTQIDTDRGTDIHTPWLAALLAESVGF